MTKRQDDLKREFPAKKCDFLDFFIFHGRSNLADHWPYIYIYIYIYMPLHKYWYRCSTRATSISSQQDTHNYKYFKVDYSYHDTWLHSTNSRQEQSKPKRHPKLEHMPIYLLSPCHRVSVCWHATRCNSDVVSVRYKKASAKCSCCIQRKRNCQIERRHNMHATD